VLENASFHPGRSGRNHLRVLAAAGRHPEGRVEEVLALVGLSDAADRRVKGYSMGMRQRLAIAAALLGDPEVLILDEPTNGLDPPGIRWVRDLLRSGSEAGRGRAVLVSSHLLSEVAQSVDDVVVISHGVLKANEPLQQVLGSPEGPVTRVRAADLDRLAALLTERGVSAESDGAGALTVRATPDVVGVLVAGFAVEPALVALVALVPEVGRFGPFGALPTAAQGLDPEDVGMPEDVDLPAAGVAVLLLLAWIGSAFAGGAALLRYRDLE